MADKWDRAAKNLRTSLERLDTLTPAAQSRMKALLMSLYETNPSYAYLVTEAYRDPARQNALYPIGRRGIPGEKIVTNARGGKSRHQSREAADIHPMYLGRMPGTNLDAPEAYNLLGARAVANNLTWGGTPGWGGPAGDWGHVQLPVRK